MAIRSWLKENFLIYCNCSDNGQSERKLQRAQPGSEKPVSLIYKSGKEESPKDANLQNHAEHDRRCEKLCDPGQRLYLWCGAGFRPLHCQRKIHHGYFQSWPVQTHHPLCSLRRHRWVVRRAKRIQGRLNVKHAQLQKPNGFRLQWTRKTKNGKWNPGRYKEKPLRECFSQRIPLSQKRRNIYEESLPD